MSVSYNDIDLQALLALLLVLPSKLECLNLSKKPAGGSRRSWPNGIVPGQVRKMYEEIRIGDMMNQGNDGIVKPLFDGVTALSPAILTHLDLLGIKIRISPAFNSFLKHCDSLTLQFQPGLYWLVSLKLFGRSCMFCWPWRHVVVMLRTAKSFGSN
jgi:hypothetical protein